MEKTGTSETGPICDLLPLTFFLSPSQAFCVLYRHLMASPGANLVAFFCFAGSRFFVLCAAIMRTLFPPGPPFFSHLRETVLHTHPEKGGSGEEMKKDKVSSFFFTGKRK
jgi:hypothetical protein